MQALSRIWHGFDANFTEVLGDAAIAFVLRGLGAVLAFALNAVIARTLGPDGAGLYFLALAIVMIVSVIARMGLDNALLRHVAANAATGAWGQVHGVFRLGIGAALGVAMVLGLCLAALAPWLASEIFAKPDLALPLSWMAVAVLSFSALTLLGECLKGLKRIAASMLTASIVAPALALALVWSGTLGTDPVAAVQAYVTGTLAAALAGLWLWRRAIARHPAQVEPFAPKILKDSARPLLTMTIVQRAVIPWAPLLLLGIWSETQETGIFGAATRIVMLMSFLLMAVNAAIAPKFSGLHARGEHQKLTRLARQAALGVALLSVPPLAVLLLAPSWVMSWFGPAFAAGGQVLAILALGQAVNAMTGSCGYLLTMTGHERDARTGALIAAAVLLTLCLSLIPSLGMIGAAIAAASALAAMNICAVLFVHHRLGILILPLPFKPGDLRSR